MKACCDLKNSLLSFPRLHSYAYLFVFCAGLRSESRASPSALILRLFSIARVTPRSSKQNFLPADPMTIVIHFHRL